MNAGARLARHEARGLRLLDTGSTVLGSTVLGSTVLASTVLASDGERPARRSSRPPASWGTERSSKTRLRRITRPLSIVVIDDHADTVDMISGVLRHAGWSVRAFTSAEDGHASIRQSLPDVVLTDIAIGDTNGRALLRELRLDPATAGVRVVAMSGMFDPTGPMTSGFDLWLVKPLDVMGLDDLLRTTCSKPRG